MSLPAGSSLEAQCGRSFGVLLWGLLPRGSWRRYGGKASVTIAALLSDGVRLRAVMDEVQGALACRRLSSSGQATVIA